MSTLDVKLLKNKNPIGKKIAEARTLKKISQAKMAKLLREYNIDITQGAVGKWEQGMNLPNPYQLFAVCDLLELSPDLSHLMGDVPTNVGYSEQLNRFGNEMVQSYKDYLVSTGKYNKNPSHEEAEIIYADFKVYLQSASAGTGNFIDDDYYDMVSFPVDEVPSKTDFGIRIKGDSMEPKYHDGDIAWVKETSFVEDGEIGIFILDNESYIKKMSFKQTPEGNVIKLISLNSDYEPIEVKSESFYVVGKVLN